MKTVDAILPLPLSLFVAGFLLFSGLFSSFHTFAQRCATIEYQKLREKQNPHLKTKAEFEEWLRQRSEQRRETGAARAEAVIYTIPVVVHVIHNGEAPGVEANISDQQIISQLSVLTEDFRRMNADASKTPTEYVPLAADLELEFVLAKRDPEGLPTTGIVRVNGLQEDWELAENYQLKSLSYWPAEDYLNIWVTDIAGSYLGFAQFPTSQEVDGLDDASNSRLTDGVVIDYKAFGSRDKYPSANLMSDYDLGRTTTHEVGHFFGLRHIWGDDSGGCTESDYVDDTPNQGGSTENCPENNTTSCGSTDMIQNFMDYTDDACMNLFTLGQKARVRTILDNSPRRASLRTSEGAIAPVVVSDDLGIRNILNPGKFACSGSNIPLLEVRNYGDNHITSAEISVSLNGALQEAASFFLDLAPLDIGTVTFAAINLGGTGEQDIEFEITAVNGTTDGNDDNNVEFETITIPESVAIPFRENFNNTPPGDVPTQWSVINPDNLQTWEAVDADNGEDANTALFVNFYDYEIEGEYDTLLTPVFDLMDVPFAVLSFARAYAKYPGISNEGLIIKLSDNCGKTFEYTLYESYGDELATNAQTSSFFVPSGSEDWERECIVLEDFLGLSNLRIAFIGKNGHGNNLYLDDVSLDTSDDASDLRDMAVLSLSQPALVSCPQQLDPVVIVKNQGCTIENQFQLSYQFDNGAVFSDTYTMDAINPGETLEITLDSASFGMGTHTYTIELTGTEDKNAFNDVLSGRFYIDDTREQIPVREDFENMFTSDWLVANNSGQTSWEIINTNKGVSLYLDAEARRRAEDQWVVSPVLDFTAAQEASLSFDLAYAYADESKDGLKIMVSTDCGVSYDDIIFNKFNEDLNTGDFTGTPRSDEDWSVIDLNMNQYLGEDDVRIAFIGTNANGNDMYLDNIQMFVTRHIVSGINEVYPNPSDDGLINITFDLPEKETVQVLMYNTQGQLLSEHIFPNTLNQTYTLDHSNKSQGIYLIKVVGASFSYVKRIVLQP